MNHCYHAEITNTLVTQTPSITDSSIPTEIPTQGNTKEMAFVLTTSFVCVLLITVTLIVLSLWMKIKRGYFEEFVYYKCCWGISMHKHKLHQQKVAATDNTEIYSLTLPKSNSLDPYSVVDELKLSGCRTSDVLKIEKKKKNQLKNINIDYVNHKNNTGSSSKHCNEKLTQPKSATAVSESSKSPTKLKRFKVNDGQYTLVDKPKNDQENPNHERSKTPIMVVKLSSDEDKETKAFNIKNVKNSNMMKKPVVSKSIYTSQEGLLNDTDIVDNEDDPVTYASIFAQYK
uniref:Polymorphic transmembrane cluster 2 transmembrane protein 7 n=1 Tax=Biomphalaria glabrata TaxID=6526 RepID=A0A7G8ZAX2_BIOGL|nr:polymorphic transmembrane cluster 2 transmembrane protein 7 [Biomphalaria glabrata]